MPLVHRSIPKLSKEDLVKFWCRVVVKGENDCWVWTGALRKGRAIFRVRGKQFYAARVSYKIERGKDLGRLLGCHECDNKKCVNPKHIFAGTFSENMQDKVRKGLANVPFGARHRKTKLSDKQVLEIIALRKAGETSASIGAKYGVSTNYACRIANGYSRMRVKRD